MSESTQQSKQKTVKRNDPPPRPVDGLSARADVEGKDPTKHYVWVDGGNNPTFNIGHYRTLGYKVAQYDPAEAQPTFGFEELQQGDAIKANGMVLMECSLEHKKTLDQVGWDRANQIEETIRNQDIDPYSREERVMFKGIKSVRDVENDDRQRWQFGRKDH